MIYITFLILIMSSKSLKLIIAVLLSIIFIGLVYFFYKEHGNKQDAQKEATELSQKTKSNDEAVIIKEVPPPVNSNEDNTMVGETTGDELQTPKQFLPPKPANCQIELADKRIYNGDCTFWAAKGGSFSITGFNLNQSLIGEVDEISVEVDETKTGKVFGSNEQGSIHEWGQATRSKGCWIGSNFKVCAYAKDSAEKTSSAPITKAKAEPSEEPTLKKEPVRSMSKEEELEHVRKVLDEGNAPPEVKIIVYCTRKAEIYHTAKDMREAEVANCINNLNPNLR
ncbi:hypothetical protein [Acinetobacter baumannii]|uniref:hypothetical protein n=1 Tax=Acinetobacter baumannii TaxID=470 RepID=UPI0011135628|nr:hypothetical protein [Acinetobacter baumannii]